MASAHDSKQLDADTQEHVRIYKGIMKNYAEVGVPGSMALAMFFTQLVMGHGWWAPVWAVVVFFLVLWVVKTFFSH